MILHSDQEGNDCIRKLRCHCIQILHSDIYSVFYDLKLYAAVYSLEEVSLRVFVECEMARAHFPTFADMS